MIHGRRNGFKDHWGRDLISKYPKETKFLSFHEHNGEERLREIGSRLESEMVVYVSDAGMPIISDPGQILG